MNTTTASTETILTTLDSADAAWFAQHPGAIAYGRLPHTDEHLPGDGDETKGAARLVIVYASDKRQAVREGPMPAGRFRWLRFDPRTGELLDAAIPEGAV